MRVTDATQQHTVRRLEWKDHRGGQGLQRIGPEGPFNRCWDTAWDTRYPGHLMPNGALTTASPSVPIAGIPLIGELNSLLIVAIGTAIYRYIDGVSWTVVLAAMNAAPTDVKNGAISDGATPPVTTEYLVFAHTGGVEYGSGTSVSASGTWGTNTTDAVKVEFHDDKLWGISATGQLWYVTGANIAAAGTNQAKLNLDHGETITGMFTARAKGDNDAFILYVVTSKHLYQHNHGEEKFFEVTDITIGDNNELVHQRPYALFKGKIYLASGRSIIEYDPINLTVDYIGFDNDDGLPAGVDGRITCMAASTNELFVGTKAVKTGVDTACIMAWNGQGWRRIYTENDATEVVDSIHVSRVPSTAILIGVEYLFIGTTNRMFYLLINNSQSRPANISSYVGAGYDNAQYKFKQHILPIFSDNKVTTIALRLILQVEGASTTVGLKVFTSLNQAAQVQLDQTYTSDSTFDATDDRIEAAGTTTFSFPSVAAPAGTEFRDFQIALQGSGTADAKALDVNSIVFEYLEVETVKESFEFTIDLREDGELPIQEMRAKYVAAKAQKTLLEFTYRDDTGGTRNYYVKIRETQGDEETGYPEEGTVRVRAEVI